MPEKNKYFIENIYQGGYSTFKPYPTAGNFPVGTLGETTNPRSANILKEVSDKLASGTKKIEVEGVTPEVFDSIPKQYFKEVERLAKLTGTDVSLHGPVMDVAGFDLRSGSWSESQRELAQRKVAQTLLRGQELKPDGNVTINFHSAEGIQSSELLPPSQRKEGQEYKKMIAVNRETGRIIPLEGEKEYYPYMRELDKEALKRISPKQIEEMRRRGESPEKLLYKEIPLEQGAIRTPEERLKSLNHTEWDNSIAQAEFDRIRAHEILANTSPMAVGWFIKRQTQGEKGMKDMPKEEGPELNKVFSASTYIEQAELKARSLFDKAYKYGTDKDREFLKDISKEYVEILGIKENLANQFNPVARINAVSFLNQSLSKIGGPESYVPIEQFALDNSSKTFGNAAFEAYKKFKDKSPTLVIENPPAGFALSTGKDVADLVEESRKKFVENLTKPKDKGGLGMDNDDAEKAAKKLIGATVDVGHINMLKKYGYSDKEIVKEVEKFAPYLKHIHLSDNFGNEHTELPMGMGNVALKEMLATLKNKGVDVEGMTKIIEAGQWWTNFQSSPFYTSIEGMGSPMYSTRVAPYWNQAIGLHQDYYGGFGLMLPQVNYETFGAGFSTLPQELGGQKPGAQGSRLSGRGME